MANESLTRQEELVDAQYRVGAVLGRTRRSTVYETQFGASDAAAVIKVRERDADDWENWEDPIERWRSAMDLAHPNLLKIYAVGSSTLNDVPVTYAVMERADESLAGVLATRPLTPREMREVLTPAAAALRYLHDHGYAHSRLRPSKIMAVGEEIKLSSDGVTRLDEGGSAAEDMRALGTLILQALTRKSPDRDVLDEIPETFREIAQHCLDPDPATRWTAGQVVERLARPEVVRPLPAHQLHTYEVNVARTPAAEPQAEAARNEEEREQEDSGKGIPNWIWAALAALIVIVLIAAVLRKKDPAEHASPPAAVAQQQAPAATAPRPVPTPPAIPSVAGATQIKPGGWSVIAAAYSSREPAEKRMHEMAKKWPRFNASVLQLRAGKAQYLVVLGQNLSEDEADALRKRAVAAGLPRDTYIKKLM
jgi:hypothetical protein